MKLCLSILLTAFILAHAAFGQERQFPEHNFAITPPAGWDAISNLPPQKGILAVYANPQKTRLLVLVVVNAKLSDGPMDDQYIANFEKGIQESGGGKLVSGKFIEVQGFRSYERVGSLDKGLKHFSTFIHVTPVRGKAYSLEAMRTDGDATSAPEIQQCFASFRFLTPPKPPMSAAQAAGYRTGYILGRTIMPLGFLILVVWAVIKLVRSGQNKSESRRRATPPPLPPQA